MQLKPCLGIIFSAIFICAPSFFHAQSAAAASERKFPLSAGAGFSGYNPDFDHGHLLGGTLWLDYTVPYVPWFLHGIGVDLEARDLNYGRSASQPFNLRQDTAEGGVIYSVSRYRNFRPYGKFLMGFGNTDYGSNITQKRYNDSRTISAMGGGFEYHFIHKVWLRADYEYQIWPDFFKHLGTTLPAGLLNPQGFTIGAMYHFSKPRQH